MGCTLFDFFDAFSWPVTLGILIALAIAIALSAFFLIRRITNQSQLREDQEIASYTLNTIALFYCLLIGLVVIDVQNRHNDVSAAVIKEAAILINLHRTCNEFPEFDGPKVNKAIRDYAEYILKEEWPLMHQEKNLALLPAIHSHNLWKTLLNMEPLNFKQLALYQDLLDRLDQLTEARFKRLNNVKNSINLFLWNILIYGGIIVIGCSFMFAAQSVVEHVIQISLSVSFLVLVLLLILALDSPFCGPAAISSEPFQLVLERIDVDEKEAADTRPLVLPGSPS